MSASPHRELGLTDAEIEELTEHFLANTLVESLRAREVVPDVVLEVAYPNKVFIL